mmetsp:Transcript_11082/g.18136  ORF Transcript_11082/g.18136 Transcript_11082/m.18136 type:complete len:91 (+) Transcript_11082:220-492(+)|eukprot:CAMPEP_0203777558 /NCGR_PEP_ID=MMETSP0099_2-20121227/7444_1 /ASSEMBLY_ACC=CAM_ASM_000209 /TAXON_ID=96639 /ORGANISM=" , Strain NY0313808BC1" /LENGTH=90 /DNA_ID=CAMNT_0050676841 /DNA_START=95 /DNA_END=367 /DNA_ORIENTATION=+
MLFRLLQTMPPAPGPSSGESKSDFKAVDLVFILVGLFVSMLIVGAFYYCFVRSERNATTEEGNDKDSTVSVEAPTGDASGPNEISLVEAV